MTQRHEGSKCYWKNSTGRLAQRRVATNLRFVEKKKRKKEKTHTISAKRNKVKGNKTRYAYIKYVSKSLQKDLEIIHYLMSFISSSRPSIDNGDIETAGRARCWHLLTAAISLLKYQMSLFGGIFSGKSSEPYSTVSPTVFCEPPAPNSTGVLVKNAGSQTLLQAY